MLGALRQQAGNILTATRVVLIPVLVISANRADQSRLAGVIAVIAFAIAAASDVWDGRWARRWGRPSTAGRVFDHFADIGFILVSMSTYVALGLAPWWVPATVFVAFAYYVIDSQRRSSAAPNLISSRIGHVGGICNYVLIGVLVCNESLGLHVLPGWFLFGLFSLVPIYSVAGMAARLLGNIRGWAVRG